MSGAALMAQKFHGNLKITASMFHSGMENLIISNKRLEELGFKNLYILSKIIVQTMAAVG